MKTLEEVKQERAKEMDYSDWEEFIYSVDDPNILDMEFDEVAKRYAKEVAQQTIKNVCKNFDEKSVVGQTRIAVISAESNIPKL